MIFGGCLGLGVWYRFRMNGRIRALRSLRYILELLAGEVRYGQATLPECCGHIARYLSPPFDTAFEEIGRQMAENTGRSFGEIFRQEMDRVFMSLPLTEEDRQAFYEFTLQTGFADAQMQLRIIEQCMERLRVTQEQLEKGNAEKGRMAVGLGAMGGLLLILVLW
jgi:stage III sporulation protein AB